MRLYAEDASYVPQSGRLLTFDLPADGGFDLLARSGVRVDSGFSSGDEVSTFYDAMLAKVMAWAPTREQAIRMLVGALRARPDPRRHDQPRPARRDPRRPGLRGRGDDDDLAGVASDFR